MFVGDRTTASTSLAGAATVGVSDGRVWLQLDEMRELSSRNVDVSDRAQAELKNARRRIDELNSEMNKLITQVSDIYYYHYVAVWVVLNLLPDKWIVAVNAGTNATVRETTSCPPIFAYLIKMAPFL